MADELYRKGYAAAHTWLRGLGRACLLLLGIVLCLYPVDWTVWTLRSALGGHGMDAIAVTELTAATLKGNRFEVYSQQQTFVNCSRSLLPQAGAGACWWLRRHPQIIKQY